MRRLARRAFVGLCLALSLGRADAAVAQPDALLASAVAVEMTPPVGVPLAGYGDRRLSIGRLFRYRKYATYFEPSTGTIDPVFARVLYLRKGSRQLLFVTVDLIGADRRMRADLVKRLAPLGVRDDDVLLSASHTHSGPGAFARNWVWELVAADTYMHAIYKHLVQAIYEGVVQASSALEPATLSAYAFQAQGLQINRRDAARPVDPSANVLLVQRADGSWIASLTNLAIHGTALTAANLLYSADVTGRMQREFEQALHANHPSPDGRQPVVLFINGAEGDVAPAKDGAAGMEDIGKSFAAQAISFLGTAQPVAPDWSVVRSDVTLGRARFNLKACVKGNLFLRIIGGLPNLAVATAFPRRTRIWAVRLGDQLMLTWPGEPITSVGLALKQAASTAMARQTWVLGLTNDHLSYFVDPDEYKTDSYEACSSLYGAEGGSRIVQAFRALLATVPASVPASAPGR